MCQVIALPTNSMQVMQFSIRLWGWGNCVSGKGERSCPCCQMVSCSFGAEVSWILTHCFQDSFLCFYFLNTKWLTCHAPKPWAHPSQSFFTKSLYLLYLPLGILWCWGWWCFVLGSFFSCSIPPTLPTLRLTWRGWWRYLYKHLRFSASLLALFDASEKVHFTPEPSCTGPSFYLLG